MGVSRCALFLMLALAAEPCVGVTAGRSLLGQTGDTWLYGPGGRQAAAGAHARDLALVQFAVQLKDAQKMASEKEELEKVEAQTRALEQRVDDDLKATAQATAHLQSEAGVASEVGPIVGIIVVAGVLFCIFHAYNAYAQSKEKKNDTPSSTESGAEDASDGKDGDAEEEESASDSKSVKGLEETDTNHDQPTRHHSHRTAHTTTSTSQFEHSRADRPRRRSYHADSASVQTNRHEHKHRARSKDSDKWSR